VLTAVTRSSVPVSRADVAARTGLTKATVSTQADRLLRARLIVEGEPVARVGPGRPAAGLSLCGDRVAAIGLEIGVDHLTGCVRDLRGAVRHRAVAVGDHRDRQPAEVVRAAADLVAGLRRDAVSDGLSIAGVGVGVPGLVDTLTGQVLLAPNLGWRRLEIGRPLSAAGDGVGVVVENEATLSALAEMGYPTSRSEPDVDTDAGFVVVSGEVGIGAGVVMDGELVRGRHGWSGELGHVTVDAGGDACGCGARGCLEVFAGQEAILLAAGRAEVVPTVRDLGSARAVDALGELVRAAEAGEGTALAALSRAGTALGVALSSAVNMLDVDAVVLGGIYARLAPWVVPQVERELSVRVLRSRLRPVRVVVSRIGPDAAMLGAAALVLRDVLSAPVPWLVS